MVEIKRAWSINPQVSLICLLILFKEWRSHFYGVSTYENTNKRKDNDTNRWQQPITNTIRIRIIFAIIGSGDHSQHRWLIQHLVLSVNFLQKRYKNARKLENHPRLTDCLIGVGDVVKNLSIRKWAQSTQSVHLLATHFSIGTLREMCMPIAVCNRQTF